MRCSCLDMNGSGTTYRATKDGNIHRSGINLIDQVPRGPNSPCEVKIWGHTKAKIPLCHDSRGQNVEEILEGKLNGEDLVIWNRMSGSTDRGHSEMDPYPIVTSTT